ncbi:MAG: M20/M25/M40 family metallo-hydrolase [Candidatus Aminicenantes bacterium]|nr:M20/M25/M40 family metallo-hydrolase [Candidatus Aminicenantes bacterium]
MTIYELTKAFINIPSITGHEGEIADFVSSYLKSQDFDLKEQIIEERRRNILATAGSKPRIILCTHMDTVPQYFAASEDEYYIYGRGACDAKGIMASMIWAAQELKKDGLTEIGLLFVVGEETDSIGAKMANSLRVGSRFIIVGEPTENKLGIGHKGLLTLKVIAKGKAAHSACPELGESAIEKLLDALQRIRLLDFGKDPVMGKSVLNVGTIKGGVAANVVANHASAEVSIRSALPIKHVLRKVKAVVNRKVLIEVLMQSEAQRLFTVPGIEQIVLPFGTDIPHLKSFGKPLLLGPGSFLLAHTEREKIEKRQLSEAVEIYENLVRKLLK